MGPHVIHELSLVGIEVICINRSGIHPNGGQAIGADRNDYSAIKSVLASFDDYTLIDMVPYTARQAAIITDAIRGKKVALIAISSIDVYQAYNNLHPRGEQSETLQPLPLKEDDRLRESVSFQGIDYDKLNVERIYRSCVKQCTILRMPAIYGLPDLSRVERYARALTNGEEIRINPEFATWRFSRAYNKNCAFAVSLAVRSKQPNVFNIAEPQDYSEQQWCRKLARLLNTDAKLVLDPGEAIPHNMNAQQHWIVDSTRIRRVLGYYEKYNAEEGLIKALDAASKQAREVID